MNLYIDFKEPILTKEHFYEVIQGKKYEDLIRNIEVVALECCAKTHDIKIMNKVFYPEDFGARFAVAKDKYGDYVFISYVHYTDDGGPEMRENASTDDLYDLVVCLICRAHSSLDIEGFIYSIIESHKPDEKLIDEIFWEISNFFTKK